jgi:hypothetical protein
MYGNITMKAHCTIKYMLILARHWWLTPVILATQEAEIRRITLEATPGKEFTRPYLKKILHKKGLDWWSGSR